MNDNKDSSTFNLNDLPNKPIVSEDYIDLWKFFSNRADMLKGNLWTSGVWILALAGAIAGFLFKQITFKDWCISAGEPLSAPLIIVLAVAGLVLCVYGWIVIYNYKKHIDRDHSRATFLAERIIPLKGIIDNVKQKNLFEKKIKPETLLLTVLFLYAIFFLCIAIRAI